MEGIPFLLNLLAYFEIIDFEKKQKKQIFKVNKRVFSGSEECKDSSSEKIRSNERKVTFAFESNLLVIVKNLAKTVIRK